MLVPEMETVGPPGAPGWASVHRPKESSDPGGC